MSFLDDYPSLQIWFDGACVPNPGKAAYGWIIKDPKFVDVACDCDRLSGKRTNNYAEYCGLGFALRYLVDRDWHGDLLIYGDSMLVVKQMRKRWKCKKPHLKKLRDRCLSLLKDIGGEWFIDWVPREQNQECDDFANSARRK